MATLKLTIVKAKSNQDGSTKVRVALCHKHTTSYIVTKFSVTENQWKNGQVVKRPDASAINLQLRKLMNTYQEKLDSISNADIYSCSQLKNLIACTHLDEEKTFSAIGSRYVEELIQEGRKSYATSIERNNRYFLDYTHGDVMLEDISPMMIQNYAAFIRAKGVSETTVNTHLAQLKAVINRAIREQVVTYTIHPFISTRIGSSPIRKLNISMGSLNKIINFKPTLRKMKVARDLFLLSFYMGGINLVDIMQIDFRSEVVEYVRTKTSHRSDNIVCLKIQPEAREIISRWMDKKTGILDFKYKFTYHNFSQYISYTLADIAKELGIKERLTFYSARKTFAQFASDLGLPDSIIDYCLGHSDKTRGVLRYYTQVRQKQADMAIARVIDYTKHPEQYKEYLELKSDIMMMRI